MKIHRINALLMRHLYLYKRSLPRLMDIFYWPIMELLLWGFLSIYLSTSHVSGVNIITILLGAIIFWDLLAQSQRAVSVAFLEDVWERNFLNLFVTPLRIIEFLTASVLLGFVRIGIVGIVMAILAFLFYHFNIFAFGFALIPLVANLLLFGWILGIFTTGVIMRYGTSAQVLAFGFIMLIQPFSAVFYPVSSLPATLQYIAYIFPSTYVFEGMREIVATGALPLYHIGMSFGLNMLYLAIIFFFFYRMFAYVKRKGLLLRLDS